MDIRKLSHLEELIRIGKNFVLFRELLPEAGLSILISAHLLEFWDTKLRSSERIDYIVSLVTELEQVVPRSVIRLRLWNVEQSRPSLLRLNEEAKNHVTIDVAFKMFGIVHWVRFGQNTDFKLTENLSKAKVAKEEN